MARELANVDGRRDGDLLLSLPLAGWRRLGMRLGRYRVEVDAGVELMETTASVVGAEVVDGHARLRVTGIGGLSGRSAVFLLSGPAWVLARVVDRDDQGALELHVDAPSWGDVGRPEVGGSLECAIVVPGGELGAEPLEHVQRVRVERCHDDPARHRVVVAIGGVPRGLTLPRQIRIRRVA